MTKQLQHEDKLKIFTWHIHGSYLYYLTHVEDAEFYVPFNLQRSQGYSGKTGRLLERDNLHEIPADEVKNHDFDIILFQSNYGGKNNYLEDQYEILSEKQRRLPKIYLEHEPPREHPTDTKHVVNDASMLLVHVTSFNELMWDNGVTPTTVIEHGVQIPQHISYSGEKEKGIVVINDLYIRGRRLGLDIFETVRKKIPLDLVGMNSEKVDGIGSFDLDELHERVAQYRFFFNPIRYTSMGMAVCEAMMLGIPIVGLATTEMPMVIENDINGYIDTNLDNLINKMKYLLDNPYKAKELGENAQQVALQRFSIDRFVKDWEKVFRSILKK